MLRSTSTYTVAAIEDGDDDKWRKLLSDADFLAAVETSDELAEACLLYTSPSPRDGLLSRMPSSA